MQDTGEIMKIVSVMILLCLAACTPRSQNPLSYDCTGVESSALVAANTNCLLGGSGAYTCAITTRQLLCKEAIVATVVPKLGS